MVYIVPAVIQRHKFKRLSFHPRVTKLGFDYHIDSNSLNIYKRMRLRINTYALRI